MSDDPIDDALAVGCMFDWISPLAAWIQDLRNGPSITYFVPHKESWLSGGQISRWLHEYGIHTWGHMIVNDDIMFTLKEEDAEMAEWLLSYALCVPWSAG